VVGDAADPEVLIQAHVARAGMLLVTPRDVVASQRMLETALTLNPGLHVVVLAASDDEAQRLRMEGAAWCLTAEQAQAEALRQHVLAHRAGAVMEP